MTHIHLIGIGGTGLSAIALVLLEKGNRVSGSDRVASPLFDAITSAGAQTYLGHAADHVIGADLVIRSSAIPDDNAEVLAALNAGIPVLKRTQYLGALIDDKDAIAVAGTHGKTTTSGLLVWVLEALGTDPSYILGGTIHQLKRNAKAGAGLHFVIEADEYDRMFLGLRPKIAVVTNMEHDHPDCFPTVTDYRQAFIDFLSQTRSDGFALINRDDPGASSLVNALSPAIKIITYGRSPEADYRAEEITFVDGDPQFSLIHRQQNLGLVRLTIPGLHNVLNATATLAVIHQLGLNMIAACDALTTFTGVGRRFEILGEAAGVTVIDDYGHHPTEIAATLTAARTRYPDRLLWAVWQPHTFSRTQALQEGFISALSLADRVVMLKIYGAREDESGFSVQAMADRFPDSKATYLADFERARREILAQSAPGDIVIVFSAGDATELSRSLYERLQRREKEDGDR